MQLIFKNDRFEFVCDKSERQVPKEAGFRFDWNSHTWYTTDAIVAYRVAHYNADAATLRQIEDQMKTDAPTITYTGTEYVWRSSIAFKDLPKKAGFRWNPDSKVWVTSDWDKAAKLEQYMDSAAQAQVSKAQVKHKASVELSRSASASVSIPAPAGLDYLPYQKAGIQYALDRDAVLIGDEMGLGKTIQAIGVLNANPSFRKVLIVCPASLRLNWKRELEKWQVNNRSIAIVNTKMHKTGLPDADIVICNYDIAHKYKQYLDAVQWDVLIADEAHYLKNPKTKRTQSIFGSEKGDYSPIKAHKRIILTGTPIPNRVKEIWPILRFLDGATWNNFVKFGIRYCAGHQGKFGWDFDGASYLSELQDKLRSTVMVRRLKADVLKELPPKVRQVIHLDQNGAAGMIAKEQKAYADFERITSQMQAQAELALLRSEREYEMAVASLQEYRKIAFQELSKFRHALALEKVEPVIEFVQNAIEDENHKVVLFAHHTDVIERFKAAFGDKAVSLTGSTPMLERQKAVDRFQTDKSVQVFIGNILAAGVGLTLTASSHVVFAELDWVPANMQQAEDRTHRIGQVNTVLVQHLVFDGSLDAKMAQTLIDKQAVMDALLDKQTGYTVDTTAIQSAPVAVQPVYLDNELAEKRQNAYQRVSVAELDSLVISAGDMAKIHAGLRIIASYCDGATALDNMGFNRIDSHIGKLLASKSSLTAREAALGKRLVTRYKRQLPEELRF